MAKKNSGFTLLEIILVTAIIGIAVLVVVPTFLSHDDEQKIVLAASEIQDALKYAKSTAQRDNSPKKVEFNTANDSFQLLDTLSSLPEVHPSSKSAYIVKFSTNSLLDGVDLVSISTATGIVAISFLANGQPDASYQIFLSYGSHRRIIYVDDVTGRVWVQ